MQLDRTWLDFRVDERGVPACGRRAELDVLARAGYADPSAGRLFEGHVNALELIGRVGDASQLATSARDAAAGRLFGVWNTQDAEGVHVERTSRGLRLRGRKTFGSGAGTVARALITGAWPDGRSQLLVVPMDEAAAEIDRFSWRPMGMERSDSFSVRFDGIVLDDGAAIGPPAAYEAAPWFLAGAIRFVAVQIGTLGRIRDETYAYLEGAGRERDPFQQARIGAIASEVATLENWFPSAAAAWDAFDANPGADEAEAVSAVADLARVATERGAFAIMEAAQRAVGARGLLEPLPLGRLVRDLSMYLRQPAPDAALVRIAERASRAARRIAAG